MRSVFLDYETVSNGDLDTSKLRRVMPGLQVHGATGTDNVDLAAAGERAVGACNVRAYRIQSVMQQVWAMILSLTQHVHEYTRLARDGSWVDNEAFTALAYPIRELSGRIDVLPQEPPANGDPLLDPEIPNLLLTPHVAWAAREARRRCLDEIAANVQDFLSGGRRARVI